MATFTETSLRHIRTLEAHGALLHSEYDIPDMPLTLAFCQRELNEMIPAPVHAVSYLLVLPGVDGEFAMIINRDGTVESGSRETVDKIMEDRSWNRSR